MTRRTHIMAALLSLHLAVGCGAEQASNPAPGNNNNSFASDAGVSALSDAAALLDAGNAPPPSDAGTSLVDAAAPVDTCNPLEQSGCAHAGDKCVVEGPNMYAECVPPTSADLPLGAACEGRDCEAGLACALLSSTSSVSACVKICDLTSGRGCDALGPDYECRTRLTGTNWGSCGLLPELCDPYTQQPCARDEACQPFLRRTGTWEFRCRAAGPGSEGAPCGPGSNAACARELACVSSPSGAAFCRRICQVNTDCVDMAQCSGAVSEPAFMYCSP